MSNVSKARAFRAMSGDADLLARVQMCIDEALIVVQEAHRIILTDVMTRQLRSEIIDLMGRLSYGAAALSELQLVYRLGGRINEQA